LRLPSFLHLTRLFFKGMCLVLLSYRSHPRYPLVLAANRDEFYARPTAAAGFRQDAPGVLAGRDLEAGGTWLGFTRTGRIALVTNYRDPAIQKTNAPSRGALTLDFLTGQETPEQYLKALKERAEAYNGFNLIVGDRSGLWHFSNREGIIRELSPGVYGLSNHLLDTPWPKVERGKAALRKLLDEEDIQSESLLEFLSDRTTAPDDLLPDTGVGIEMERVLSAPFVAIPGYGTRCSTAILVNNDGQVEFTERTHVPDSFPITRTYTFYLDDTI